MFVFTVKLIVLSKKKKWKNMQCIIYQFASMLTSILALLSQDTFFILIYFFLTEDIFVWSLNVFVTEWLQHSHIHPGWLRDP